MSQDSESSTSTSTDSGGSGTLDVDKLSRSLEAQLAGEEEMTITEDFSSLEREYLADIENAQNQLNFACFLIRHPDRDCKLRGSYLLYRLEQKGGIDQRVLTFYLGVANYRLHFWAEAKRYANMMLTLEPTNRQALAFQALVERRSKRRYLCRVNNTAESDLAFNRLLELIQPGDNVLLLTDVDSSQVERTLEPGYESSSVREERVETIGNNLQERYRQVLDHRKIQYNCVIEEGDTRQIITEIATQESVDVILIGMQHPGSGGLLGRLRPSHALVDHLLQHTHCDVIVLQPPIARVSTPSISSLIIVSDT